MPCVEFDSKVANKPFYRGFRITSRPDEHNESAENWSAKSKSSLRYANKIGLSNSGREQAVFNGG